MEFELDLTGLGIFLSGFPSDDPLAAAWWVLTHGGFVVLGALVLYFTAQLWLESRQEKYAATINYSLLAVDVPKDTMQIPTAVEHIFAALAATKINPNFKEKWWDGKTQVAFSYEVVSLGGYTQFLVRTPTDYRDMVEASIYAQYPDAEIVEVEDYVTRVPLDFDTDAYDLWGTEFELTAKDVYPIKTYQEFEHQLSEEFFKDPMAGLLEVFGRIKPDEDVWLQLIITPTGDDWKKRSKREVDSILKRSSGSGSGFSNFLLWLFVRMPAQLLYELTETLFAGIIEPQQRIEGGTSATAQVTLKVSDLTPGERKIIEAIEHKASKIGFLVKFRMVYWGQRDTFLKGRGVSGVVGAVQQFSGINGFKPSGRITTKADYFLKQSRINTKQRSVLSAYRKRSRKRGLGGFILNTEELATLYHFPVGSVKAPLVKKTEVKKAEPPSALPVFAPGRKSPLEPLPAPSHDGSVKAAAPDNLPFIE